MFESCFDGFCVNHSLSVETIQIHTHTQICTEVKEGKKKEIYNLIVRRSLKREKKKEKRVLPWNIRMEKS